MLYLRSKLPTNQLKVDVGNGDFCYFGSTILKNPPCCGLQYNLDFLNTWESIHIPRQSHIYIQEGFLVIKLNHNVVAPNQSNDSNSPLKNHQLVLLYKYVTHI
jgi:hypothetical protein